MRFPLCANLLIAGAAMLSLSGAQATESFKGLPFIHDDYGAAIAEARKKDVPIFIDATAAWCHSCLSMQRYVFTDAKLAPVVNKYVWLELDMEKPENAEFREKFPVEAFPTYFILDPRDEKALIRWIGGCSVERVLALLEEATLAYDGETPERLALADALYAEGKNEEAALAYQDVFDTADPGAPYYARTVESLLFALSRTGDNELGFALAQRTLPLLRQELCAGNIASYGLDFAIGLPEEAPDRQKHIAEMEAEALAIANDKSLDLVPDDRSGIYIALLSAREAASDDKGYKKVAAEWATFLNGAAATAKTSAERAVFDSHRLSAYLELGEPQKAVPLLERSERDFPEDYNPPARLALAYRFMEEWDKGVAASARALSKPGSKGPRRLRILQNLAAIHEARGDIESARRTLTQAVRHGEVLPQGQRPESLLNALKKKLDDLGSAEGS